MLVIAAFLRATALIVAGYFVWFAASKAGEDRLKTAGKIIAGWCAFFAVVLVVAGIASAVMHPRFHGPRPGMMRGGMMHDGMMGGPGGPGGMMPGGMMQGGPGGPGGMMPGGMMGPRFLFRGHPAPQDAPAPAPKTETPSSPKS